MRPHGHYEVNPSHPRALGTCDFCGRIFNHEKLRWNFQWVGPKLQNQRFLVCNDCWDVPQEQLRTIVLPPDPEPIFNARPENYVSDNNPLSGIGASPNWLNQQYGSFIGNLTGGGGLTSAFDGNKNKPSWVCARNTVSNSSFNNYIGVNWTGWFSPTLPSSLAPPVLSHTVISFTAVAPSDRSFLGNVATDYYVQASPTDTSVFGAWTTISSGTTTGVAGEIITADTHSAKYQFARIAFSGDGINYVAIAQLQLDVAEATEVTVIST